LPIYYFSNVVVKEKINFIKIARAASTQIVFCACRAGVLFLVYTQKNTKKRGATVAQIVFLSKMRCGISVKEKGEK
jgi:hypothetical protein